MLNEITNQVLYNPKVIAAANIFKSIQDAGKTLKSNLMMIAGIIAVISIIIGGLMFFFGRRGADNGKSHIFQVLAGVFVILGAVSIVVSLFAMFGQNPQGL